MDVNVRAAHEHDEDFIVEMAREASTIENRPLPAADSEEVRSALPQDLGAAVVALNLDALRLGAAWWHYHDPPLARDASGRPLPELIVAVRVEDRGHGIGSSLIEALTLRAAEQFSAIVLNVHIRNPAARLYSRSGFTVLGAGRGPLGVAMRRDL
jgi:GNAT superfamily N-acetyltransferase